MKIVLDARAIDLSPFGVGRHAWEVATRLIPLHPEWDWFVIRHEKGTRILPGKHQTIWTEIGALDYVREQIALEQIVSDVQPDLVHSLWFPTIENATCPRILTVQDVISQMDFPEFQLPHVARLNLWYRRTLAAADHIIVPSFNTLREVCARFQYPATRISSIPLAASAIFGSIRKDEARRRREKLGLPAQYLYCSGHFFNALYKNTVVVRTAMDLLDTRGIALPPMVSAGMNGVKPHPGWIHLPYLSDEDLSAVLQGALFMVFPSREEGFGLPVLEAMACGTPVICSRAASLPEVAGDAALYFDPSHPEQLADAIVALLTTDALRARLHELGLRRVRHFSWQKAAEDTAKVYEQVMATCKPRISPLVNWARILESETIPPPSPHDQNPPSQIAMIQYLFGVGKPDEAVKIIKELKHHPPDDPDALRELGRICQSDLRWFEAEIFFRCMYECAQRRQAPDHLRSATFHLGETLFQLGRKSDASRMFEECLSIKPDHKAARKWLTRLHSE